MIAALALLALQQPADTGRAGRPCRVAIDSVGRTGIQQEVGPRRPGAAPMHNYFAGGGVWAHCEGTSSSLTADSVAWYAAQQRLDLVGHVQIRDDVMHLDATTARYLTKHERLEAHRDVVAVNRRTGTVLRGPNLTYWRAAQGIRDTTEMQATSRPTIDYRAAEDTSQPYVIVADRVRMKGDSRMWAGGRVTVDRSDLAARGDSMMMDEAAGLGVLVGRPQVEGKGERAYTLTGVRIEMALDSSEIRLVKALGKGEATGEDWRLTADTIHLGLAERKLQQTLAWGDSVRPRAVSTKHTVEGDSLALDTPGEVLTELRAFGRAAARRHHRMARTPHPEAGPTAVLAPRVLPSGGPPRLRVLLLRSDAPGCGCDAAATPTP